MQKFSCCASFNCVSHFIAKVHWISSQSKCGVESERLVRDSAPRLKRFKSIYVVTRDDFEGEEENNRKSLMLIEKIFWGFETKQFELKLRNIQNKKKWFNKIFLMETITQTSRLEFLLCEPRIPPGEFIADNHGTVSSCNCSRFSSSI